MKRKILIATGLIAVTLGTYVIMGGVGTNAPAVKDEQSIKQLVQDYSTGIIQNQSASITSRQLIVAEGESKSKSVTYDLPENEFFVSIAPYVKNTHPCATHSLTGCRGEMMEEEFDVFIQDKDGNVIVDQTMKSQSNGFIDLWLPRDQTYSITVEHDGKKVDSELSTFDSNDTCITTMQLV